MLAAAIRAQPLETPPQQESGERQRGAHSRIGFVGSFASPWRAAGESTLVRPKEI